MNLSSPLQSRTAIPPPSGRSPTAVGLKSPSTVHFHLKRLEEAGVITRGAGKTRAITAVRRMDDTAPAAGGPGRIPVLGNVAAGEPILAQELRGGVRPLRHQRRGLLRPAHPR